jgi:SnoaL-like domain
MRRDPLQYLLDRADVSDTVKAYFMALDRFDWDTVAALVADEFTLETDAPGAVPYPVPREEYVNSVKARNGGFTGTIHLNPDHLVTVTGDTARVIAHMWAAHSVGPEPADSFWGYGIYEIHLVRTTGGWRLTSQRIDLLGGGGEGSPADIFARSAARQAAGLGRD